MRKNLLILSLFILPFFGNGQVLLNEGFDNGIPSTWTIQQQNQSNTWESIEDDDGNLIASVEYDLNLIQQDEWLITPAINLENTANFYYLNFEFGMSYYWAVTNDNYNLNVKISTDNGATWTQIWTESDYGVFTNWERNAVTLNLSQFVGQSNVKIAYQYIGVDGAQAFVDNVKVEGFTTQPEAPNCPTILSPTNGATNVEYLPNMPLSWSAAESAYGVTGYDVHFGTDPATLTLLGTTPNTSVGITDGTELTTYYWSIVPKNSFGSATGCSVNSFTTMANPFSPYCGPLDFSYVETITNVTFAGINNTTDNTSTVNHEIFLDQIANVTPGETYTISMQGNTEGDYINRFFVFIDWNQNGVFDENEKYVPTANLENSTGSDGQTVTMDITVPEDAIPGQTRMRVKKTYGTTLNNDPCLAQSIYGQAEDYTVNVGDLGTIDMSKTAIKVYPNPVVDYLNVSTHAEAKQITITDVSGKKIKSEQVSSKVNKVDMSTLPNGVYIINVQTEEGTQSFKIIKK